MQTLEAVVRSRIINLEDQLHEKKNFEFSKIETSIEDLETMLNINKNMLFSLDESLKQFIQ